MTRPPSQRPEFAAVRENVPVELARRLASAFLSYQMGIKSVDYWRKHYMDETRPLGDLWYAIAAVAQNLFAGRGPMDFDPR